MLANMDDLGAPGSYLTLEPGTAVYDNTGEHIGDVEHVLADADEDIFDGIVIDRSVLPGGHRFADSEQVDEIHEKRVTLSVAASELTEPTANAATLEASPDDPIEGTTHRRLRRAWDYLSGNY